MLRASAVWLDRGTRAVLRGVDARVAPGELVALCGPNGAGKSTLLSVFAGDLTPDRGAVTLDGAPLSALSTRELACRRAVLPQHAALDQPLRAEEVVALGRLPHGTSTGDAARVARALERVGAAHLFGRRWTTLSGGERQRVALARVLCQLDGVEGGFLLLDEPTSALDLAHQHQVLALAHDLRAHGLGVLVVLHDLGLAGAWADRIVLLRDGVVRAEGTPREVLDPALVSEVFGLRVSVLPHPVTGRPLVAPDAGPSHTPILEEP